MAGQIDTDDQGWAVDQVDQVDQAGTEGYEYDEDHHWLYEDQRDTADKQLTHTTWYRIPA